MVIGILIAVGVVLLFLVFVALQPPEFRVSRSQAVTGSAADVFTQVNDLHAMNDWSPWLEPDPQAKLSYDGPPAGAGASFTWNGNNQVGEGRLTIVESRPNDLIRIKLEFMRPFKSTADAEFTFQTEGEQVVVTWTMIGRKIFMTKLFGLIMSMDKMIGGNFEKGLAKLKTKVESLGTPSL